MSGDLPRALYSSPMTLLGVDVVVHVLDNGQRVFEADGFERLLAALFEGGHSPADIEAVAYAVKLGKAPERPS